MNRYRTYGQEDDQSQVDGDVQFTGVNSFDAPENLKPGELQSAVNMDFSQAGAATRGGFVCIPSVAASPIGNYWTAGVSLKNDIAGVVYGNKQFVAVSYSGGSELSQDGRSWSSNATYSGSAWDDITYGGGYYIAVGSAAANVDSINLSQDGITWVPARSCPSNSWKAVTFGNGYAVAVGYGSGIAAYSNGSTSFSSATIATKNWTCITYGNGLFVAGANGGTTHEIATSPDGITWTTQTNPAQGISAIAYGNGLFVAVGTTGTYVMTSPDGVTWTTKTGLVQSVAILFANGQFLTTDAAGSAATSPDGINWTLRSTATANKWYNLAYGSGIYLAMSYDTTNTMYSTGQTVWASGSYSDPNATSSPWIVACGATAAYFYAFGQTTKSVNYPSGYTISQQSTVVQANNYLFIFSGPSQTPIYWDGAWGGTFVTVPLSTLGVGYEDIPWSNQATYYQNRLWAINGKDTISASGLLDFTNFNILTNVFNLNVGSSDYVVTTYPFGNDSLIAFKNRSSYLLQNVTGALTSVTSTEITRQLGIIGINALSAVGPDVVYMSDRNISTIRLNIQNAVQHVTEPLSRNIPDIMKRVNWQYAYKVSMGFWNNQLFIALPLDNSTVCNAIVVYNFITESWYGEWNFNAYLNMAIQGFVVSNNTGQQRLHIVTEDGRIFVLGGGQNDISGSIVCEIATSMVTRAYRGDNNSKIPSRMYADISTNRPSYSITAYAEGAGESSTILSNQTYSRSQSWIFNDSTYALTNANDDYNRAFRKDYSTGPDSVQCGSGFLPEMTQNIRIPLLTRRKGRLSWFRITNDTGYILINGVGYEARSGDRSSLTQVG